MSELKILIHIGHHLNVVNLLGACTKQGGENNRAALHSPHIPPIRQCELPFSPLFRFRPINDNSGILQVWKPFQLPKEQTGRLRCL